ncbi:hypothetical protein KKE75_02290, partial [Patescibacteria group bacterium]|nr:hypothetical protein [Patescibacteria group bacterium]
MGDASPNIEKTVARVGDKSGTVVSYKELVETETGERIPTSEPEILLRANQGQDTLDNSLLGQANRAIMALQKPTKEGIALTDGELRPVLDHIEKKFPGGNRETAKELKDYVVKMIFAVQEKIPTAPQLFEDLDDPVKAGAIREKEENADLVAVYDYVSLFGEKTGGFSWKTMLAYAQALQAAQKDGKIDEKILENLVNQSTLDDKGKKRMYQALLEREGYSGTKTWKSREQREKAFDKLLDLRQPETAVDVQRFLKLRLYDAVAMRLGAMRSSAVSNLEKSPSGQKMEIGRPKNPEHFKKGFSPSLVFHTVEDTTVIGQFLDDVGQGAYWRGKACLDVLYWSLYKGQIMGDSQSRSEARDVDIFSSRKDMNKYLREYAGAVALSYMEKDPKFIDALNILYNLNQGMSYEQKLKKLSEKYGNFNINEELPGFVTDAVMFEKVYVLDAMNMSRADLRIEAYHPAQIFESELVTDAQGRVMQFLGKNMRFTESPMMKLGWWDASNARFNYEAMVPDLRDYEPGKNWDQKDKIWQHCGMYLLEIQGRRSDLKRIFTDEGEKIIINGKWMTATPGQSGEFLNYQNERIKKKKGEEGGEYDHRRGVYSRIAAMNDKNAKLLIEKGFGMAGWDDRVIPGDSNSLTIREAVANFVDFCRKDLSGVNTVTINNVLIDKGPDEIFYNDELAVLLNDFEADSNNPAFAQDKALLDGFLNMRNVLRNLTCWGFTFDLNDPEVQKRLFNNQDLTFVEKYDLAAHESKGLLAKLIRAEATSDVYALQVTPAQVLEAVTEFGHRRSKSQNYWPMMRFLGFVEAAMLRRLTEMEIASMQDLTKYIDPMGQVKLGATEEIQKLLGIRRETYFAHKSLLGEIENKGYMEKMKDQRLVLAEKGLIRGWTNAMRSMVERLRDAEALQWTQQRDIPLQQMAGMYEEIADGYDESGLLPVESWQVMDVVREEHEIHHRNLLTQSLNRTQINNFFDEMTFEEAGEALGGARKIALDFRKFKE